MRLLRLRDVDVRPDDRVFRHRRLRALLVWLVGFGAAATMCLFALSGRWKPGYVFGPVLMLFVLATTRFVSARFHPSNWLVRANANGLAVHYRSYLNDELSADEPSVAVLEFGEIRSARLVRERVETPDPSGRSTRQTQHLRYVEFELAGDTAPLATALQSEHAAKAPVVKRWYGSGSTLYRDYPVTLATPPFLRIRWDVAPGASALLESLRPYTRIAEPVSLTQDFSRLQSLGRAEQREQLRNLAMRGQVVTAIYLARQLYGFSLEEAKDMVAGLAEVRK